MAGTFPSSAPWYKSGHDLIFADFSSQAWDRRRATSTSTSAGSTNAGYSLRCSAGPWSKGKTILFLIALLDSGTPTSAKAFIKSTSTLTRQECPNCRRSPKYLGWRRRLAQRAIVSQGTYERPVGAEVAKRSKTGALPLQLFRS